MATAATLGHPGRRRVALPTLTPARIMHASTCEFHLDRQRPRHEKRPADMKHRHRCVSTAVTPVWPCGFVRQCIASVFPWPPALPPAPLRRLHPTPARAQRKSSMLKRRRRGLARRPCTGCHVRHEMKSTGVFDRKNAQFWSSKGRLEPK